MISTTLNHCKEMGAEPSRRFLKELAANWYLLYALPFFQKLQKSGLMS